VFYDVVRTQQRSGRNSPKDIATRYNLHEILRRKTHVNLPRERWMGWWLHAGDAMVRRSAAEQEILFETEADAQS